MGKPINMAAAQAHCEEMGEIRFSCLACQRDHTIGVEGRELSKAYVFAVRMTPCPCGGMIIARRHGFDLDLNGVPKVAEVKRP